VTVAFRSLADVRDYCPPSKNVFCDVDEGPNPLQPNFITLITRNYDNLEKIRISKILLCSSPDFKLLLEKDPDMETLEIQDNLCAFYILFDFLDRPLEYLAFWKNSDRLLSIWKSILLDEILSLINKYGIPRVADAFDILFSGLGNKNLGSKFDRQRFLCLQVNKMYSTIEKMARKVLIMVNSSDLDIKSIDRDLLEILFTRSTINI
jgi:hypothetical protein